MGSSASTPSRPRAALRLGVVLVGDDDPRRCTGRRLVRLGLADQVRPSTSTTERPVVLDPYAQVPLSVADRPRAETAGVVAVDCSWNRLSARRSRGPALALPARRGERRRLPLLVAANPQHFGRPGELNTVEALAAALVLVGHPEEAQRLLDGFAGGPAFLEINADRLARYARATSPGEVSREERAGFEPAETGEVEARPGAGRSRLKDASARRR